jgi:hypothetical protein
MCNDVQPACPDTDNSRFRMWLNWVLTSPFSLQGRTRHDNFLSSLLFQEMYLLSFIYEGNTSLLQCVCFITGWHCKLLEKTYVDPVVAANFFVHVNPQCNEWHFHS